MVPFTEARQIRTALASRWVFIVGVLLAGGTALATDFYNVSDNGSESLATHATSDLGGQAIDSDTCAGESGCCCTDNIPSCTMVELGEDQICSTGLERGCDECCNHNGMLRWDGQVHAACCASGGGCCQEGPACTKKPSTICFTTGSDCISGTVFPVCDSVGTCPPASQRLVLNDFFIGTDGLAALFDGSLQIRFEFDDATSIQAPLNTTGKVPPGGTPIPLRKSPAMSRTVLFLLIAAVLVLGVGFLFYRSRMGA